MAARWVKRKLSLTFNPLGTQNLQNGRLSWGVELTRYLALTKMIENGRVNPCILKIFLNFLLKIVIFQRFRAIRSS